mmetsp:Transcript_22620/g.70232  ORF Transcript_22620/g.70232 Transcript_22620/m.70232 type:complete len:254 (-) Transcript_22620:923-1684(-)
MHEHLLQHEEVVGAEAVLLRVLHESFEVPLLCEARRHLVGHVGLLENLQGHVGIPCGLDQVAELLRALELALVHPVVEEVLLVLPQHQPRELHTLVGVEAALGQQRPEVLQQRRGLPWLRHHTLELGDRLASAQHSHGGGGGGLGCLLVLPEREHPIELLPHERLRPGQVAALGEGQGQVDVVELLGHERNHRLLVDGCQQHLPAAVHRVKAADGGGVGREEYGVRGDAVPVHGRSSLEVVHKEEAELGDAVD